MPRMGRPRGSRNVSDTPKLIQIMLVRADKLLTVALKKDVPIGDAYQAMGMVSELLDDADHLFCQYYYDQIPEGQPAKSFEELIGRSQKAESAKVAMGGL